MNRKNKLKIQVVTALALIVLVIVLLRQCASHQSSTTSMVPIGAQATEEVVNDNDATADFYSDGSDYDDEYSNYKKHRRNKYSKNKKNNGKRGKAKYDTEYASEEIIDEDGTDDYYEHQYYGDDSDEEDYDDEEYESDVAPKSYEIPAKMKGVPEQILKREGYVLSYNKETRIPNWVGWHLTASHADGTVKRPKGAFHEDTDVPRPRPTREDYKSQNWSRGHMCPAGDNKWDEDAMYDTFLFTNMCPQDRDLNNGVWNDIEMRCRSWARNYGDLYIVTGPILRNKPYRTMGPNKVVIPDAFYKVILCTSGKPKAIAFICDNVSGHKKMDEYVTTVDHVEEITGIDFFPMLDEATEKKVESESDLSLWKKR